MITRSSSQAIQRSSLTRNTGRLAVGALLLGSFAIASTTQADTSTAHSGIVSENPIDTTPYVLDGRVEAIAVVGNRVIVGGNFTQVQEPGGPVVGRNYLFAYDRTTGAIDPAFTPQLNSFVWSLAPGEDGQSVFVGGRFTTVNGQSNRKGLTKLDMSGAIAAGFTGRTNGRVKDLVQVGGVLYIAGNFTKVKSAEIATLAAVDPVTGEPLPHVDFDISTPYSTSRTTGGLSVDKIDVSPDGSRLVMVGNFSLVNGQSRARLAVIDLTTAPATLADWSTQVFSVQCQALKWPQYIRDMDISPDGTYFVVVTTGAYTGGNAACDTATRWELGHVGSNLQPTWVSHAGGDTFYGVGLSGDVVYVGGHMRWMNNPFAGDRVGPGAVDRRGMAALDPLNGVPFSWRSDRNPRGLGTFELLVEDEGLYVGDDTDFMGGEYHPRLKMLPLIGATIPRPAPPVLPTQIYQATSDSLDGGSFDGATFGGIGEIDADTDWDHVRGMVHLSGALFYGRADGTFWQRGFDGTNLDAPVQIDLNGLTATHFPVANITGMFFDHGQGRLYYTVAGVNTLYYRYFTPESTIVGAQTFSATTSTVPWAQVRGMAVVDGHLYYGLQDGNLHRIQLSAGLPVAGTDATISGPGIDGRAWNHRAMSFFSSGSEFRPPAAEAEQVFESQGSASSDSWQVFEFPVVAGDQIVVRLEWADPASHLNLFLRDTTGTSVANDTGTAPSPKTVTHTATASGTHSVGIKIKSGATTFRVLVNPSS